MRISDGYSLSHPPSFHGYCATKTKLQRTLDLLTLRRDNIAYFPFPCKNADQNEGFILFVRGSHDPRILGPIFSCARVGFVSRCGVGADHVFGVRVTFSFVNFRVRGY